MLVYFNDFSIEIERLTFKTLNFNAANLQFLMNANRKIDGFCGRFLTLRCRIVNFAATKKLSSLISIV